MERRWRWVKKWVLRAKAHAEIDVVIEYGRHGADQSLNQNKHDIGDKDAVEQVPILIWKCIIDEKLAQPRIHNPKRADDDCAHDDEQCLIPDRDHQPEKTQEDSYERLFYALAGRWKIVEHRLALVLSKYRRGVLPKIPQLGEDGFDCQWDFRV